jgi:hypothetical protein
MQEADLVPNFQISQRENLWAVDPSNPTVPVAVPHIFSDFLRNAHPK